MKYLETKHERNSAKITGLTVLIVALLFFVVGPPYKEIPEEYGVAINFGEPSQVNEANTPDKPSNSEAVTEEVEEEVSPEQEVEDELIEDIAEDIAKEDVEDNSEAEAQKELEEQKAAEEAAKQEAAKEEAEKQKAVEELLAQQEEEALRIKEAKEKAEAEQREKERIEAKRIADSKAEAERIAKAKADKEAKEKAEREAQVERERLAKAKAAREGKERADKAAAAKAAKAEADRKAAAAAAAEKNKSGGSISEGFKLSQEGPIFPGCEGKNNTDRKQCMNQKVSAFFSQTFDSDLAATLGLSEDQSIRIYFKISKTGQIIDVRAKAAHPKLEQETKRVISLLPKIRPAMQQGQPTTAPYSTSIRFKAKE
ncbi:colicin import membrane protein [Winogradskyella wandonensis]|uniref:Colicin import membrane protein n=1 Tax=Winogradskyella wandonensis TaxID=1442586 RepID=A0A4V2PTZ2_9FLAO|nr:cell envelope integrity protein TolA [Winogradskyella wandonensis]TCK68501.1 colicin import membrane protein [Winogradskyella wandonensis]